MEGCDAIAMLDRFRFSDNKSEGVPTNSLPKCAALLNRTTESVARKHLQAREFEDPLGKVTVEILCKECRRGGKRSLVQPSLSNYFARPISRADASETHLASAATSGDGHQLQANEEGKLFLDERPDELRCNRCRRSLQEREPAPGPSAKRMRECPFVARLRQYQKVAKDTGVAWALTDSEAVAMMREPCAICGAVPDVLNGEINGITRLKICTEGDRGNGKGVMGPFNVNNTLTACTPCNKIKGAMEVSKMVKICMHISTIRALGAYGHFPDCFRNNTSKRSRSSYLTDSKTHSLSNAEFDEIVSGPCHYCGKASNPPFHYNGLDRLDSTNRVYNTKTCVSCCGTCNVCKWRYTEEEFLGYCKRVAQHQAKVPR
mmetsp:Transcript_4635/g.8682  ORF Transcript_4635/g.8682 Transcript_4635/m.8682 type:complete len:375 (+) Transcript_4635:313-1437(+)